MRKIEIIIITGLSGAGKTTALNIFEDLNYYTIDNLPPPLFTDFLDLLEESKEKYRKIAIVMDIRGGMFFSSLYQMVQDLKRSQHRVTLVYLTAGEESLVRRYKELRRRHPLQEDQGILKGIHEEEALLQDLKAMADFTIDTSQLTIGELKRTIKTEIVGQDRDGGLPIYITSFGFKRGILLDADLVYDVRFIPNPYYIEELRPLTGLNKEVKDYVFQFQRTQVFIKMLKEQLDFLIPWYVEEGKESLTIGIGCTGGKHRSVAIAQDLYRYYQSGDYSLHIFHRDQEKW